MHTNLSQPFLSYIVSETAHFVIQDITELKKEKQESQPSAIPEKETTCKQLEELTDFWKTQYKEILTKTLEWLNKPQNSSYKGFITAVQNEPPEESRLLMHLVLKRVQEAVKKYHFSEPKPKL